MHPIPIVPMASKSSNLYKIDCIKFCAILINFFKWVHTKQPLLSRWNIQNCKYNRAKRPKEVKKKKKKIKEKPSTNLSCQFLSPCVDEKWDLFYPSYYTEMPFTVAINPSRQLSFSLSLFPSSLSFPLFVLLPILMLLV